MLHLLFVTLVVPQLVLTASLVPCPDTCHCDYVEQSLDVTCENFDFLNKLVTKQYSSITSLRINGSALEKVNPKLKYLKNLETLDVSHNNIYLSHLPALAKLKTLTVKDNSLKDIRFSELPENVETLDLSDNYLSKVPRDWRVLKHLKTINLSKNPINCDCQNVLEYQEMRNKVGVVGLVVCSGPKEFRGKSIESVECSPLDMMLGDEGSGEAEEETDRGLGVDIMDEDNEVKVADEEMSVVTEGNLIVGEVEGSGDEEGSGFGLVDMPRIDETEELESETEGGSGLIPVLSNLPELPKACVENCTENSGLEEEANASPLPGIKEQFDILNGDLFQINGEKTTTVVPITTVTEEILKPVILKESEAIPDQTNDKKDDKENYTLTENTKLGRASVGGDGSYDNTIYVIMGVIFLALVCIVIFFIKKKNRSSNNRRKQIPEENFGEELKPLEKKPLTEKIPLNPDRAPLMNGNGKVVDDIPKEDDDLEFKEVDIRPKDTSDLLTPKRERVTIKETEIPDSIPKTPLLVHREVSSDGQIVLTPIDNP